MAGASKRPELKDPIARAVERSASEFEALFRRAASAKDARKKEALDLEAAAWTSALWAAAKVGADVRARARTAASSEALPRGVREEAIRYLSLLGAREDAHSVEGALVDPHGGARALAAEACARLEPDAAEAVLSRVSVADPAAMLPLTRAAIASKPGATAKLLSSGSGRRLALWAIVADRRERELIEVAAKKGNDQGRLAAIAALGRIGGQAGRDALEAILADRSEDDAVRALAFKAKRRIERRLKKTPPEGDKEKRRGGGGGGGGSSAGGNDDDHEDEDGGGEEDDGGGDDDWSDVNRALDEMDDDEDEDHDEDDDEDDDSDEANAAEMRARARELAQRQLQSLIGDAQKKFGGKLGIPDVLVRQLQNLQHAIVEMDPARRAEIAQKLLRGEMKPEDVLTEAGIALPDRDDEEDDE
jgi:hypothetical protein